MSGLLGHLPGKPLQLEGKELGLKRFRFCEESKRSELDFRSFPGSNGPNSGERGIYIQQTAQGAGGKGHVKKRQKSSRSVKHIFHTFRHFSRRAKNVKNRVKIFFDTFRQFSRGTSFPAPFGGL